MKEIIPCPANKSNHDSEHNNNNNIIIPMRRRRRFTMALTVTGAMIMLLCFYAPSSWQNSPKESFLRPSTKHSATLTATTFQQQRQRRRRLEEITSNITSNTKTFTPHKPLFPLSSTDILGFTIATFALMLAAGGGIGGGGILVPLYILLFKFTPKHAIPLSNVTVLGGAIANTLLNVRKRHPLRDRPLIDWDLILIMEPLTIGGALVGALVNKVLSDLIIVTMLVLLLSVTAYTTLKKAKKMYDLEGYNRVAQIVNDLDTDDASEVGDIEIKNGKVGRRRQEEEKKQDDDNENVQQQSKASKNDVSRPKNSSIPFRTASLSSEATPTSSTTSFHTEEDLVDDDEDEEAAVAASNNIEEDHEFEDIYTTVVMNGNMKLEMDKTSPHNNNQQHQYHDDLDLDDDEDSFFESLESSGLGANLEDELEKNHKKKQKKNRKSKRDMRSWYKLKSQSQREKFCNDSQPSQQNNNVHNNGGGGKPCYPPIPDDASPLLRKILEDERKIPKTNVFAMTILFVVVLIVNTLKGGAATSSNNDNNTGDNDNTNTTTMVPSYSPLGIKCNSPSFWILQISIILFILSVLLWAREYLLEKAYLKNHARYVYLESDIIWTPKSTLVYPSICGCAGFFAGMFGIGGGIVKGPLMIAMGIHPAVASATSACMIFFTSFTATTSFVVFGLLIRDYGLFCLGLGFVSTILGQTIMSCLLRRYQRNSYIAFSIGLVVLLSAICMTVESVVSIVGDDGKEDVSEFGDVDHGLCSTDF